MNLPIEGRRGGVHASCVAGHSPRAVARRPARGHPPGGSPPTLARDPGVWPSPRTVVVDSLQARRGSSTGGVAREGIRSPSRLFPLPAPSIAEEDIETEDDDDPFDFAQGRRGRVKRAPKIRGQTRRAPPRRDVDGGWPHVAIRQHRGERRNTRSANDLWGRVKHRRLRMLTDVNIGRHGAVVAARAAGIAEAVSAGGVYT